jgi:CHAT domain-containing protein/tetratricopeptide (TPR) repeat protein
MVSRANAGDHFAITELQRLRNDDARAAFLDRHLELRRDDFLDELVEAVVHRVRVDSEAALALARASRQLAEAMADERALAKSYRALGTALYGVGDYRGAIDYYDRATELFDRQSDPLETGRTLSTSLQARILLGEYDSAFAAAGRARGLFVELGDRMREARLDINVGNIFHRQDRFHEALELYERSYRALVALEDPSAAEGVAAALSNLSGCLIMLNDFPRALTIYREARKACEAQGMPRLVARADYNIAYMYYLRGEFSRSIEMLNTARQLFRRSGDEYHGALCDMDQAEIYIDVNLYAEAAALASRARKRFSKVGTTYEQAKSMALEAIVLSNQGKTMRSLELFARARESFVAEGNRVWPWTIDLYRALVYSDEGRSFEARRLAKGVLSVFEDAGLGAKAIVCRLLLARIAMRIGDVGAAEHDATLALERATAIDSPLYIFQAQFLMGQIQEAAGRSAVAFASYERAASTLESLRSSLQREEMKIAFLRNRLGVYESLVELSLRSDSSPATQERALHYIERSKARALIDLILGSIRGRPQSSGESELARRVQLLREELNWYYRRIEHEQLSREGFNPERLDALSRTAKARESELLDALRELPEGDPHFAALRDSSPVSLARIQAALGRERSLVEYYVARGRIYACVVSEAGLSIQPLAVEEEVKSLVQRLQFQISKFELPNDYVDTFEASIHETTLDHLRELYENLIAPLKPLIQGRDLVIVPHTFLHYLPFHALYDGSRYVIDDFAVSYAPSASVFVHCQELPPSEGSRSLVMGVSESTVPYIRDEVSAVAQCLGDVELVLDADASLEVLRSRAPQCRVIHIATHGYHRKDNPMFSAIRLGDSYLSLYDLYELSLPVDLITVSACATGLSVVVEGDEILGLVRGLLHAGARALVATLWNVHDGATSTLMQSFYSHMREGRDPAAALRYAMLEQREKTPQPYYWAPYLLVGKVGPR